MDWGAQRSGARSQVRPMKGRRLRRMAEEGNLYLNKVAKRANVAWKKPTTRRKATVAGMCRCAVRLFAASAVAG